ncbi:uncharacterized protein [Clinocottus analis]|uniref:uncharacterized protein n=1 Tax=Clinocottus analis TaxID=304258 RepID=UPI0035BF4BA4
MDGCKQVPFILALIRGGAPNQLGSPGLALLSLTLLSPALLSPTLPSLTLSRFPLISLGLPSPAPPTPGLPSLALLPPQRPLHPLRPVTETPSYLPWYRQGRCHDPCFLPTCNRVLVSSSGSGSGPVRNLLQHMQAAWTEMGLPGTPTFIDLRTAVSTHAKNHHTPSDRTRLAEFMCHNTGTADQFYAQQLDRPRAMAMRQQFQSVTESTVSQ